MDSRQQTANPPSPGTNAPSGTAPVDGPAQPASSANLTATPTTPSKLPPIPPVAERVPAGISPEVTRSFITAPEPSVDAARADMEAACERSHARGADDNGVGGTPTIGVLGDSVDNQLRYALLADTAQRWVVATHCGENYTSALMFGRVDTVIAHQPDVLVSGMAHNNISYLWTPFEELYPIFETSLRTYLDATDDVPCRIIFNAPERWATTAPPETADLWRALLTRMNTTLANIDHNDHPNVVVIDWRSITAADPALLLDDQHLSHAGINRRANLITSEAARCQSRSVP